MTILDILPYIIVVGAGGGLLWVYRICRNTLYNTLMTRQPNLYAVDVITGQTREIRDAEGLIGSITWKHVGACPTGCDLHFLRPSSIYHVQFRPRSFESYCEHNGVQILSTTLERKAMFNFLRPSNHIIRTLKDDELYRIHSLKHSLDYEIRHNEQLVAIVTHAPKLIGRELINRRRLYFPNHPDSQTLLIGVFASISIHD